MESLVTIGMPVYNDVKFVGKAIESILKQSFRDFIFLIFDDNSNDGSEAICRKYELIDNRIIYKRNKVNLGISRNMKSLLDHADSKYFMWAANDDYWASDFLENLVLEFERNNELVSVFCSYNQVSENGSIIREGVIEDFEGDTPEERLFKLIKNPSDGFGYGLFKREIIKDVEFPVWVWPNNKCPYNNIYPTLFYYLARGQYKIIRDKILWFNLMKSTQNINHKFPFSNIFILSYISFVLRKFNLVCKCFWTVFANRNTRFVAITILPHLFYSWFLIPVFLNLPDKYRRFKVGEMETFI
jgi:glycosyltransferase involved in cell wall biosynthesis